MFQLQLQLSAIDSDAVVEAQRAWCEYDDDTRAAICRYVIDLLNNKDPAIEAVALLAGVGIVVCDILREAKTQ